MATKLARTALVGLRWILAHLRRNTVSRLRLSGSGPDGRNEALVAIMDEPFSSANQNPSVPRFTFHVYSQSELMMPLEDLVRSATTEFEADADPAPATAAPGRQRPSS